MMDRRTFIGATAALAAAPAAARKAEHAVGLQLYTLRTLFEPDPVGTLEKVARIGYREVEYGGGGYDRMDHAMLRRTMDRLGLRAPSIHVGIEGIRENFAASVTMARALGADTLILASVDSASRTDEGWKKAVELMNRRASELQAQGLGFAYHNHDWEFTDQSGGMPLFDYLVANGDPSLVELELDVFWAIKAGRDPEAIVRRVPGRIYAYHVKDMTAAGAMTSVGLGELDYATLFKLNRAAGVRHFYVENDRSPAPYLPDVTTSYGTVRRLLRQAGA